MPGGNTKIIKVCIDESEVIQSVLDSTDQIGNVSSILKSLPSMEFSTVSIACSKAENIDTMRGRLRLAWNQSH